MTKIKLGALLASTAAVGIAMTPVERRMGRVMRAPDHPTPSGPRDPIEAMMDDGGVEGQWSGEDADKKAPPKKAAPAKQEPVDEDADEEEDEAEEGADSDAEDEDVDEENEEADKPKKAKLSAKERIQQLNRTLREERRARANEATERENLALRLERLEKGLPSDEKSNKPEPKVAPDPTDLETYPLGALDDRYIEDKLEFLAEKKAEEKLNGILQREQEKDQQADSARILAELTKKADTLTEKGVELFDDFEEVVLAAKSGKFPLTQETFEACVDAHHGAAILRDLHLDLKEAEKVAAMSPYQQLRYVLQKDDEKGGKPKPKLPKAGDPPSGAPRGTRGKFEVADDTDDLEAFGKKFDKA